MKFFVTATSDCDANHILEKYKEIEQFHYYIDEYESGMGWIVSDLYVDIPTIEELVEFSKATGKEIIVDGEEIEIYDEWRE